MKKRVSAAITAPLLSLGLLVAPLAASAYAPSTVTQTLHLQATFRPDDRFAASSNAPVEGTFDLQIHPNNIVTGFYRPEYAGDFVPLTGGLSHGDEIWLDVGLGAEPLRVYAKLTDNKLVGTASLGFREFTLDTVPVK